VPARNTHTSSAGTSRPVPTTVVEHLLARHLPKGFVPGPQNRRSAKCLDSGARQEERMVRLARKVHGDLWWRAPGISSLRRNTGEGYRPDAAGLLPTLTRYARVRPADSPGKPPWNCFLSVKSQNTGGSAKQKILTEIDDVAGVCDRDRVVAALILQGRALDPGLVAAAKAKGEIAMVAVLTEDEVGAGLLVGELERMDRRRAAFARKLGPRGGLPAARRRTSTDWAYVERASLVRRAAAALVSKH